MTALIAILYWVALFVFAGGALAFSLLAWLHQSASWVAGAAGSLMVALIIAALSSPSAPPVVAILLTLVGVALAVLGGGPAATVILDLATRGSVRNGEHGGILVKPEADSQNSVQESSVHEVLRGGLTIGVLERVAVVGSILAGFPSAVAIIVAVKSVGRFSELDAAEARERFIIGTLASLTWACACAALIRLALG